jgi:hypothetical protein
VNDLDPNELICHRIRRVPAISYLVMGHAPAMIFGPRKRRTWKWTAMEMCAHSSEPDDINPKLPIR